MGSDYFDPRQLEVFIAVMSIGSMTGAAKALERSQPVITRMIRELEAALGYALLHRNGPRLTPTEKGVAFFAQAELYMSGLRTITERGRMIGNDVSAPIEIASIPSLASSLVPSALAHIGNNSLPSHVHVHSMASENVVQAVAARTADLGFASQPLDNPGVEIHHQFSTKCIAVVAENHALANHDTLSAADLEGQRLIASANPYRLRMSIDRALAEHEIKTAGIIDSNATTVSMSLARQGLGVAIVESLTPSGMPLSGIKTINLDFDILFHWAVISALGRPLSLTVQRIVDAIPVSYSQQSYL